MEAHPHQKNRNSRGLQHGHMKGSDRADILSVVRYAFFLVTPKVKYSQLNVMGDFK